MIVEETRKRCSCTTLLRRQRSWPWTWISWGSVDMPTGINKEKWWREEDSFLNQIFRLPLLQASTVVDCGSPINIPTKSFIKVITICMVRSQNPCRIQYVGFLSRWRHLDIHGDKQRMNDPNNILNILCPSQWHPLTNTVLTSWKKGLKIRACSHFW